MSAPAAVNQGVRRNPRRLLRLWFGVIAAPLAWFAQVLLNYGITALACFPAEAPQNAPLYRWSHAATIAFDAFAILVALAATAISYRNWQMQDRYWPKGHALEVRGERSYFLSVWGMLFGGGFLIAIGFETIADVTIPLCR
jgi:uncharacterized membrane protein YeiB